MDTDNIRGKMIAYVHVDPWRIYRACILIANSLIVVIPAPTGRDKLRLESSLSKPLVFTFYANFELVAFYNVFIFYATSKKTISIQRVMSDSGKGIAF
jgi:hypothetical protein